MKILVENFSLFSELTKKSQEHIDFDGIFVSELFELQKKKYQFPYEQEDIQVAINDVISSWDTQLCNGDKVVFLSPFSGG